MAHNGSPWITSLQYAFQDLQNLYLVMDFYPGGDLVTLLGKQENKVLDEKIAKFYLAESVLALHSLHELGYVHRDVKPENILIDKNGHIKLADFGSAVKLSKSDKKVYLDMPVGTAEYISPEVLTSFERSDDGYGVECDWWSLGVVAYEMMYGITPFTAETVTLIYAKIIDFKNSLSLPTACFKVSLESRNLIRGLLTDTENRFSYDHLVKHSFFKDVQWSSLATEQPPYIPTLTGVDDTSNFDEFDPEEEQPTFGSKTPMNEAFSGNNLPFVGFTFTRCDNETVKSATPGSRPIKNSLISHDICSPEDRESTEISVNKLQSLLENLKSEKDLLEKENILKETEIKDVKKSLEEDHFVAMKRTQRLEEELSAQKKMVEDLKEQLKESKQNTDSQVVERLGVSNIISSRNQHKDENSFVLQQALEEERTNRSQLQQELNKVKKELDVMREKVGPCHLKPNVTVACSNQSLAVIRQSQSQQPSPGPTLTPLERMHDHNIPHRFTFVLNMRATRCPVCLDSILFARQVSKCTECGIGCHRECFIYLSLTCGLPTEYVDDISEGLPGSRTETSSLVSPTNADLCDGKEICLEGCLKIPRNGSAKNGWENQWVSLKDGNLVASSSADKNVSYNRNLCGQDIEVNVYSAVTGSDLLGAEARDLPYVFSIEVRPLTTCWPGRMLFLLAPGFPEKQRWVRALESIMNERKSATLPDNNQKINGNLLLGMKGEERLDINTSGILNNKFLLLGAKEGLFILPVGKPGHENQRRQIPEVRNVYQIMIEKHPGLALLISGTDRELLFVDLKQLEACTKQSREIPLVPLNFQNLCAIRNCHLFASKKVYQRLVVVAALPKGISVLRFNTAMQTFELIQQIDSQPCSCIVFSNTQIIIGSHKFYQIDLQQFMIKDYVDCEDTTLAFAVYHEANSIPVNVFQVSKSSANEEFLLCFKGFGVFVDAHGKRTRKDDLKWTGVPLSFAYQGSYLYVTRFNSIEICEIPALDKQGTISRKFAMITRPRILGPAMLAGAIYLVSTLADEINLLCYQGNLTPLFNNLVTNPSAPENEPDQTRMGQKRLRTAIGCEEQLLKRRR